ncbi:hypothetical protein LZD49_03370 [Dyadobacter sp. CY261]|uniref:hypothetical protein n=1 Tax=Dyadobacter sp. CY261 TaxID=2907203 RepID=UPI001F1F89D4|nr:hypothetical protein [Dyadobacter sp. CY261]MCF0069495.1 hypothetical protein [Dyadobacter sp. CY261]
MPFLVTSSIEKAGNVVVPSALLRSPDLQYLVQAAADPAVAVALAPGPGIKWEDVQRYRKNFEDRVADVFKTNGLDHSGDLRPIELDPDVLDTLVDSATDGHYLVAHYYCDGPPLYENLNVALCIKRRRAGSEPDDDIINSHVIDTHGNPLANFPKKIENYKNRRDEIINSGKTHAFDFDKEGRGHLINTDLRFVITLLKQSRDKLYLYFILDNQAPGENSTLSVVLADQLLDFSNPNPVDVIVYDHGTQCCPLK